MSQTPKPNWEAIKDIWVTGIGNLEKVATLYGLTLPEVFVRASQDDWPPRDSARNIFAEKLRASGTEPILTDKEVILAHKTDLGRLRLIAATILETLQEDEEIGPGAMLKAAEKLARIYAQIIPLERKVYSIDVGTDGAPDGIIIQMFNKSEGK